MQGEIQKIVNAVGFIITIASGGEDIKCSLILMFEIHAQYCCKYWKSCYAFNETNVLESEHNYTVVIVHKFL